MKYRNISTLFFISFFSLKRNQANFTKKNNYKNQKYSIQRWDLNSRPFEHESTPLTNGPGLSHEVNIFRKVVSRDMY